MVGNNAFNNNDSLDINELAALSGDVSPELIDQLQQKLTNEANSFKRTTEFNENDDTTLFEEPLAQTPADTATSEPSAEIPATDAESPEAPSETIKEPEQKAKPTFDPSIDDNFIKKYKAKLNKQKGLLGQDATIQEGEAKPDAPAEETQNINTLSNGNITEKAITKSQKEYNDSLDLLDGNVKYSKYVIYVDPQNVDFIESLTVKERKNLINNILREQDDISITKKKFKTVQTVIKHTIVAVLTVTISIPVIYWAINASLEASINNYRRSQTNFQTLYKDKGKINIKQP